jgi:tetratricopeptide (TPR) repeat protein
MTATPTADNSAREQAEALIDEAWEAGPEKVRGLALRAVRLAPDLGEAYALAASAMPRGTDEALVAWHAARQFGKRELGFRLEQDRGALWLNLHARPYLRACLGYAHCCADRGDHEEAITAYRELLMLDERDALGVRYALAAILLKADRRIEFEAYRGTMEGDHTAFWLYVDAYSALDDPKRVGKRLAAAIRSNPHVPNCLLSRKPLRTAPTAVTRGGEDEAQAFAASYGGDLWRNNPAALSRLARQPLG